MADYEKYLGLPMMGGKSNVSTFKELQEMVTKRVMGWKEKHISKARREVLIKTVAQAIPIYSMSVTPQTPKGPKHERDVLSTCKFFLFDNSIHIILIKCQQQEIS